ncbi:hypothetical protein WG906_10980 [Pedobacter sp. P351]|uniref:hypothetical protein n=1 Tax=Pedobacter superstes TaxID=3133441 RepID=UPI0030A7649C
MGGLREIESIGFVCLLDADVNSPILNVAQYIKQLQEIEESMEYSDLKLSQESENKLYYSNLRIQTDLIIQIIISKVDQPVNVKNKVSNLSFKIDLNLFGFILSKLLFFVVKYFRAVKGIEISCFILENEIITCLSAGKETGLKGINNICLSNSRSNDLALSESEITLMLCYDILSFFGGNLWSQSSEQLGLKICFSMPLKKR